MPTCVALRADVPPGIVVVVEKAELRLGVYRDHALMAADDGPACFSVALGAAPAGDKQARGDEHTPEGAFRITHKNPASSFHLSLGLNYPTARHADAALARGAIDRATHDRIVAADRPGRMPARDTALGGDIYLHGGGSFPAWWTDGCVAMSNDHITWLYGVVSPGTVVWILP